ncbi:APC family permease [Pseudoalteromonas sp. NZS127]|uniref:APC family permease n=1 Tax=unclassified Pseudoalteromonas TaxID=194690 RepID=UPI0018CFEAC5|nr:APC family permease [Pseudoalteromonas sp. NZS127]MBH0072640.1 APC family permease [Pseudoalteromonas sp. NZS127]|tara:strand:- start:300 stop:1610 length:1311 start_codon:yes stop_codon:yes gene_type:complete
MTEHKHSNYNKGSLSLAGAVAMGTGVMIGAGIFALTGQVAELAREWFPWAFLAAAIISSASAYSYVKLANAYPSAGGIAMFLEKAYGKGTITACCALLMYFSMVINQSLVARTFGNYVLQLFDTDQGGWLVPTLGVALLIAAFLINVLGNKVIQTTSFIMGIAKALGLVVLAGGGIYVADSGITSTFTVAAETNLSNFLGAVALAILAFKGFTTITNSGGEIVNPKKNVGRAIIISIFICFIIYMLVAVAVGTNLSIDEIVVAKDYALAEASKPAFGKSGLWITVGFAIVATVSGVIASVFAVSRMLAMLTDMKLVPHSHFGMPGTIQKHTVVYTVAIAILLTIFFDLSRIASLGAIFYLLMDIAIHWGVFKHLRKEVNANAIIVLSAIVLDIVVLSAFVWIKASSDMLVIWSAIVGLLVIVGSEKLYLSKIQSEN